MFKSFLYIIISIISVLHFIPCYAAEAGMPCSANTPQNGGYYDVPFSLVSNNTNPNEATDGETLATLTVDPMTVNCSWDNSEFHFQLLPNGSQVERLGSDYVCSLGTNGIGVIWYDYRGVSISCGGWQDIFIINTGKGGSTVSEAGYLVGRVVRTSKPFDHYGVYNVTIKNMDVNLNVSSSTNYGHWGTAKISAPISFTVSGCVMQTYVKAVDFGDVNIDSATTTELARKSFNLLFTQCENSSDMNTFINSVKLTFSSSTMNATGKIDNNTCEECASGVDIAILNSEGTVIDLNKKQSMSADSMREGDTAFSYPFQAILEKKSSDSTLDTGKIDASLVIKIEYF
ncbi:fimbrial protein [Rahnella sp. PCH160]|uniref:fimbrial protein n=1 Tax=Rahnella sp. PCH160 TaxID=3447928 RepID=UPI0039FBCBC5